MKYLFNAIFLFSLTLSSQIPNKDKSKKSKTTKTILDLTKNSQKIEGLFTIYQDSVSGKIQMAISKDQLNKDYIYFSQVADGVSQAGNIRGLYNGSAIFNFKKYFNKIEIVRINTNFYYDKQNPISKSKEANISNSILSSSRILNTDEKDDVYLISANEIFLTEDLNQIKPLKSPKSNPNAFSLGSLDKLKSKINKINNYPENLNIKTEYVYKNRYPLNEFSNSITDPRNVSIKVFHSLIEMPDKDYKIRYDDPRVGYFLTKVDDMTSVETTNYRDMINRWRLIKKYPELELSEPIKPITWWIENSTPEEWRETIKEGILEWNFAFEKAGIKNAIEVKIQPDNANWDAGDIRYNVLRWTSSPETPWGGYGPSMKNPLTGEIFGSDIMLEYKHFTNRFFYDKLYSDSSEIMSLKNDFFEINNDDHLKCSLGEFVHEKFLLGITVNEIYNENNFELDKLKKEAMKSLIMHEIGHTLGLNHNMRGSHLFTPDELYNPDVIENKALSGSIMDYEAINLSPDRLKQGQYENMSIGPYDIWAIQFGYSDFKNDNERIALLERSTEKELAFGNDADDMRSPGKGIDPRVMTGDLSSDPIKYSIDRIQLVNKLIPKIQEKFYVKGNSYDDLRRAFYVLNSQAARAGDVISRFIGGVYVDRSTMGQKGGVAPYTPVSYNDQKKAFKALSKYVFSPEAFRAPKKLYKFLARQRRGFDFFDGPEDPKIHKIVLGNQTRVLAHVLHPNTLQRIVDSELYGNKYKLDEFMLDLNKSIFEDDIKLDVNTFRQNLQLVYVNRLIDICVGKSSSKYNVHSRSMALYNLKLILKYVKNPKGNVISIAHKNHISTLINNTFKKIG
ncbi:MAG: hypothetical protein CMC81_01540 [Flavobacteriaceae bacterium]|nr:hypothetical protein [Flavobacteriaceae bacterium]